MWPVHFLLISCVSTRMRSGIIHNNSPACTDCITQNGGWSAMKAIDVPAKKVEGWILPEMPGKRHIPYHIISHNTHHSIDQGLHNVTG